MRNILDEFELSENPTTGYGVSLLCASEKFQKTYNWELFDKGIIWKNSVKKLKKKADWVLFRPFMRNEGRCDILYAA